MAKSKRGKRYYRKKGQWSANIQEINEVVSADATSWFSPYTLVTNPPQTPSLTSQTYTVKNFEISFVIDYEGNNQNSQNIESICCYIMYVPQGMNITSNYNIEHPEYIMNYKFIGGPSTENEYSSTSTSPTIVGQKYQPYKLKTRLSRKLQSGDGVILYIKGINQTSTTINLRLTGLVRWWTKAN